MIPSNKWRDSFFWKWVWPMLLGIAVSLLCKGKPLNEVIAMFLIMFLVLLVIYYR